MNLERNEFGKGKNCMIMLHGNSLNSAIFNPLIDKLKEEFKVVTFCLPGHGNSNKPDKYSIPELSQEIIAHINNEEGTKYILAHSLSGHLVLQGLQTLKNTSCIFCVGTPPLGKIEDTEIAFTNLGKLMNKAEWTLDEENEIVDGLSKDSSQTIREALQKSDSNFRKAITTEDFLAGFSNEIDNLNKTKIPVSLIFSTDDKYIELSYCRKLSDVIENPKVGITFIKYGKHLPFFNVPTNFSKLIKKRAQS